MDSLFALSQAAPVFTPIPVVQGVAFEPSDYTLALAFTGGGIRVPQSPAPTPNIIATQGTGIAIDGQGNVWANGALYVAELSSLGAALSPKAGFAYSHSTAGAYGRNIAIDPAGNVWVLTANAVYELSSSGAELSPITGFAGTQLSNIQVKAYESLAIDGFGTAWITATDGSLSHLSNLGTQLFSANVGAAITNDLAVDGAENVVVSSGPIALLKFSNTGTAIPTGAGPSAFGYQMAIDGAGSAWLTHGGMSLTKLSSSGVTSVYPVSQAQADLVDVGIDGAGNIWATTVESSGLRSSLAEVSSSGIVLSPTMGHGGFANSGALVLPYRVAVDGSGDVWTTSSSNTLNEVIGIAVPVVTPLSMGVKNNTLGTRP